MEKLNELVELAKKATSGEWNAFISTGGDGTFSIHTPDDSRKGDIVNWPGFDTANCSKTQKKANAKYIAAANPETILAIAEAFRALEKEAQKNLEGAFAWQNRAEAAEAKLAELAKQKPRYFYREHNSYNGMKTDWTEVSAEQLEHLKEIVDLDTAEIIEVYARPAPAADLADSVKLDAIRYRFLRERDFFGADDEPGLASWDELCDLNCNEFDSAVDARMNHPDSLYSAKLSNIEEAKK